MFYMGDAPWMRPINDQRLCLGGHKCVMTIDKLQSRYSEGWAIQGQFHDWQVDMATATLRDTDTSTGNV